MTGYRGRIARSLVNARESADVSQRELAERLGRDKRTVQKWESGEMKISMEDFLEIFDALHVAVEPYSKWIRHPELFPNGLADINKFNHDKRRSALVHYYGRQASPVEVEQEYYILFADHGSDYYGMRQQRIANLQTPLRDRRRICGQIIGNYYEARELGALTDPNGPQPNMDILLACYRASAESVRNGSNRYAIPGSIGISPLSTPHAHPFQRMWLRSSIVFYDNFNLDMDRSPGFGSAYTDLTPC